MEENEIEDDIIIDDAPIEDEEITIEEPAEESEEDDIDWKERAIKAEKLIEAKKREAKVNKPAPVETKTELSAKDLYAMMEAKIPQADIDDVLEYSKLKNIPVTEALQSPVVKAILADKAEHRSVANATNTGPARRGSSKTSDESLMANAAKGILPEDDEGIKRLIALTNK